MGIAFQQVEREEAGIPIECNDTNGLTDQDAKIALAYGLTRAKILFKKLMQPLISM